MDIRSTYWRDGVVFPIEIMSRAEAAAAAARYYAFQERAQSEFGAEIYVKPHLVAPWAMEIARSEAVLDAVEQAIGPNIILWCSDVFNKRAGSGKHVGFHQDSPYWGLSPSDGVVSAWIALTRSTASSGCMQVVPRTHDKGLISHRKTYDPTSMLSVGQEVELDFGPDDLVDVELEPGQMSLHHLDLVHGGQPNASDQDRIGFVLRFVAPEVRQSQAPDSAMLLRGVDEVGHFAPETPPSAELGAAEVAQLKSVFADRPSGFGGQILG